MNISELARRLKVNPEELKTKLPELGYDFGRKAIKIPDQAAWKIIKDWGAMMRTMEQKKKVDQEAAELAEARKDPKTVALPSVITVREFAGLLGLPVTRIISELMKNGILVALNERIDFSTASIIAEDLGFQVMTKDTKALNDAAAEEKHDVIAGVLSKETTETLIVRPPVVVIMGHVDHGKTTLLDSIRKTNVVAKEAGGITQHIGAYQTERRGRKITFIDTPGHEAFTTMRSRGARVADVAILIVAADDGVQPQTLEALKIIQAAKLPFAVAVNKIDKPGADPEKVKRELSEHQVIAEEWGGTVPFVPVSAKVGTGIDGLLDVVLILADLQKEKIMANPSGATACTVIESHIDEKEGVVATVLVQNGTLRRGDVMGVAGVLYGRVRAMRDWSRADVTEALPGTPVKILGLKVPPEVGDVVEVAKDIHDLEIIKLKHAATREIVPTMMHDDEDNNKTQILNMVLKADVFGSLEALAASLEKIVHPEISVKVIARGLGSITETDIAHAESGHAIVYGFNVAVAPTVLDLAYTKGVTVRTYKIIYELLDNVKQEMEKLLKPEIIRTIAGRLKVLKIFRAERNATILGGRVEEGKIVRKLNVTVWRDGAIVGKGVLAELQSGKQAVEEVPAGNECGMKIEGHVAILEGDVIEVVREEKRERKLEA